MRKIAQPKNLQKINFVQADNSGGIMLWNRGILMSINLINLAINKVYYGLDFLNLRNNQSSIKRGLNFFVLISLVTSNYVPSLHKEIHGTTILNSSTPQEKISQSASKFPEFEKPIARETHEHKTTDLSETTGDNTISPVMFIENVGQFCQVPILYTKDK